MVHYWERKREQIRLDLDHIKRHMQNADDTEKARLKKLKEALALELETCYEALDKLA